MAKFIELNRTHESGVILINIDKIVTVEYCKDFSIVELDEYSILVTETSAEIMSKIARAM